MNRQYVNDVIKNFTSRMETAKNKIYNIVQTDDKTISPAYALPMIFCDTGKSSITVTNPMITINRRIHSFEGYVEYCKEGCSHDAQYRNALGDARKTVTMAEIYANKLIAGMELTERATKLTPSTLKCLDKLLYDFGDDEIFYSMLYRSRAVLDKHITDTDRILGVIKNTLYVVKEIYDIVLPYISEDEYYSELITILDEFFKKSR